MENVKMQQVLQTKLDMTSQTGETIPAGARVVVMNQPTTETVKVKVVDARYPALNKVRAIESISAFEATFRGRPKIIKGE